MSPRRLPVVLVGALVTALLAIVATASPASAQSEFVAGQASGAVVSPAGLTRVASTYDYRPDLHVRRRSGWRPSATTPLPNSSTRPMMPGGSCAHCRAVNRVAPNAARHLCSFSGETEVLMADGTTKPISEVEVGDWVLAEDPETGERGPREVTHLWVHQDTIIDLQIDGHDLATTEDHPFWNHADGEWQRADALDVGDLVLAADGATLTVDGMDWASARTTLAYNLTVNDINTYFVEVGGDEALVHNANGCNLWKLAREGAESTRRHSRFGTFYETVNRHGDSSDRRAAQYLAARSA